MVLFCFVSSRSGLCYRLKENIENRVQVYRKINSVKNWPNGALSSDCNEDTEEPHQSSAAFINGGNIRSSQLLIYSHKVLRVARCAIVFRQRQFTMLTQAFILGFLLLGVRSQFFRYLHVFYIILPPCHHTYMLCYNCVCSIIKLLHIKR